MQKKFLRTASLMGLLLLVSAPGMAFAQKLVTLESKHYRVAYEKQHQQLAGEILKIAESVWAPLARAYDSYDRYQRIDILISDDADDANGFAIYTTSRIVILAPHIDWVMRNRANWLGNVVTHELSHVFSLRRAAWLSPFDEVDVYGSTYNARDNVNFTFQLPWVPLVAPTWYVEGIAQFEACQQGNDSWDSQRDMVLRDAYLTGTLPGLDFIETFDYDQDWTQAERTYNTGYAFLLYLKDRYGVDKVRALAKPKPIFNFSYSVNKAFGRSLPELFEDFKRSLANRYADFKDIPKDGLADPDMVGGYQQNLAFSSDGRYMAWLGNDEDRRYPLNWIFWKPIGSEGAAKSNKPGLSSPPDVAPPVSPAPLKKGAADRRIEYSPYQGARTGFNGAFLMGPANPAVPRAGMRVAPYGAGNRVSPEGGVERNHGVERSDEMGSSGLEFNHDNTRLLTTRQSRDAAFTDVFEYEFKADAPEKDKWHRLTWEERAAYPSYHPTKNLIVYTRKWAGNTNIVVLDSTGRAEKLTNFSNGEQVYNPRFSPSGDSIYFSLGLVDKEAIVAISADAPRFDTFGSLKDSAVFPDSMSLPKNQKFTFITPLKPGAIRNVRFQGDTLLWSSNIEDSVYNVYVRLPKDSSVYRASKVQGQALEPLARDGSLYYQGYRKQRFQIFKRPLTLEKTGMSLSRPSDSLVTVKPKKEDFTKAFETGEFGGAKVALEIRPFLAVQPQFISGTKSYTDLAAGMAVSVGEGYGAWMQGFSAAVAKRLDYQTPLSYQLDYSGYISAQPIRHTSFTWPIDLYYSWYHDIVNYRGSGLADRSADGRGVTTVAFQDIYTRDIINAVTPLPYNFALDAEFFLERFDEDLRFQFDSLDASGQSIFTARSPKFNWFRDAPDHKHFSTGLDWWWSKGAIGTYLPTGFAMALNAHKFWATYDTSFFALDTADAVRLSLEGKPVPRLALQQDQYDPWSVGAALQGYWSFNRYFTLGAYAEGGAFLNTFPTIPNVAESNGAADEIVNIPAPALWPMSYHIGFYRLRGYPYRFVYRGRDIMEGTSFGFGQASIEIPLRLGAFLPGLPVTSFKQFMLSGMADMGTTLVTPPDHIVSDLQDGKQYTLIDFGLRLSANFRLYHEYPFTVFGQGFVPYNNLRASHLLANDYPHYAARQGESDAQADARNREDYIKLVKEPRFYVGFALGIF